MGFYLLYYRIDCFGTRKNGKWIPDTFLDLLTLRPFDELRTQGERVIRNRRKKVNLFIHGFPITILGNDPRWRIAAMRSGSHMGLY